MGSSTAGIARRCATLFALVVAIAEIAHVLATDNDIPRSTNSTIVVLGFPSRRNGRPHPVQRWRVRIALLTLKHHGASRLLFSGGPTSNGTTEAEAMAAIAADLANDLPEVLLETNATSTWENVFYSHPIVFEASNRTDSTRPTNGTNTTNPIIILVSDPIHAARAKRYWIKQFPAEKDRVFVTDRVRPFDGWWLKVPAVLIEAQHRITSALRNLVTRRADD